LTNELIFVHNGKHILYVSDATIVPRISSKIYIDHETYEVTEITYDYNRCLYDSITKILIEIE